MGGAKYVGHRQDILLYNNSMKLGALVHVTLSISILSSCLRYSLSFFNLVNNLTKPAIIMQLLLFYTLESGKCNVDVNDF